MSAVAAGEFALGDVMEALNAEPEPTEATEPAEADAEDAEPAKEAKLAAKGKEAAAKPEKELKSRPQTKEVPKETPLEPGQLKEDFSDEKPWTPERVKAAAAEAKALAQAAQKQWFATSKREERLKEKRETEFKEREQFKAVREQLATDFQSMRTGGPRERLEAFGRLFGVDAQEYFEEFSLELATGGKKRELSPSEKKLQEKLDAIEKREKEREQREEEARAQVALQRRYEELAQVGSDAETYPLLAEHDPEEISQALAHLITTVHNQTGKIISDAKAAQILEEDLQRREAKRAERRGDPKGSAGLEPRAAAAAKPAQAQPPPTRGRSLAPRLSNTAAPTRELDADELEDAADLIPASLIRAASPR
jgi:hypothetical protein